MTRIIRRPRTRAAAALLAASALLVAGCSSGPSQISSAAIVGDRAVALADVQRDIQWQLDNLPEARQAQQQRKLDLQSRQLVQQRVVHELLTVAAQREGLVADENQVGRLIAGAGGLEQAAKAIRVPPEQVHDAATDQVLLVELGRRYLPRVSVRLVGAAFSGETPGSTAKDQALELGRKIAVDPARAAELAQVPGTQQLKDSLAVRDLLGTDGSGGEFASSVIFGARPGSVVVFQPSRQEQAWLVALITDRVLDPATQQTQAAAEQAGSQVLAQVGLRMLESYATELGVRINPRYGVWDEAAMGVAANEAELTGYVLPARTTAP